MSVKGSREEGAGGGATYLLQWKGESVRPIFASTRLLLSLLTGFIFTSGCATIVNGTHQEIGITSHPAGASVLVDNQKNLTTPARVELKRNQAHTFLFRKDGYKDDSFVITSRTSGWVWGNLIAGGLIGGFLGGGVDLVSGGARRLSQNSVHVNMVMLGHEAPVASTSTITPAVLTVAEPVPIVRQANIPAMYNHAPAADTQLRNLDREFRAGRIGIEEYRQMKKVLQGE
jgi:hypothetical protein